MFFLSNTRRLIHRKRGHSKEKEEERQQQIALMVNKEAIFR